MCPCRRTELFSQQRIHNYISAFSAKTLLAIKEARRVFSVTQRPGEEHRRRPSQRQAISEIKLSDTRVELRQYKTWLYVRVDGGAGEEGG